MSLESAIVVANIHGDTLSPQITTSSNYKHWVSIKDDSRCTPCEVNHGKIWLISDRPNPKPPAHPRCRCVIELMQSIEAGTATVNGINGADWTLKHHGNLPNYYVTKEDAEANGWKRGKWPSNFVPNKMLAENEYYNYNRHLPHIAGRVWYKADINYKTGKRNSERIVWSNDGLVFVTYDHYKTFYEII